jgi:hypothetical protein
LELVNPIAMAILEGQEEKSEAMNSETFGICRIGCLFVASPTGTAMSHLQNRPWPFSS